MKNLLLPFVAFFSLVLPIVAMLIAALPFFDATTASTIIGTACSLFFLNFLFLPVIAFIDAICE